MKITFPRGVVVDTDAIPADFDTRILEAFKAYTRGTRKEYMYHDKLAFIDWCAKLAHGNYDSDDAVKKLILKNTEWKLDEYGELPDADEFWNLSFMEQCYEQGQKDASLYDHYTGNHRIDDVIMDLLARTIKIVMNYEVENDD